MYSSRRNNNQNTNVKRVSTDFRNKGTTSWRDESSVDFRRNGNDGRNGNNRNMINNNNYEGVKSGVSPTHGDGFHRGNFSGNGPADNPVRPYRSDIKPNGRYQNP